MPCLDIPRIGDRETILSSQASLKMDISQKVQSKARFANNILQSPLKMKQPHQYTPKVTLGQVLSLEQPCRKDLFIRIPNDIIHDHSAPTETLCRSCSYNLYL